jgi:hypothetical protein
LHEFLFEWRDNVPRRDAIFCVFSRTGVICIPETQNIASLQKIYLSVKNTIKVIYITIAMLALLRYLCTMKKAFPVYDICALNDHQHDDLLISRFAPYLQKAPKPQPAA